MVQKMAQNKMGWKGLIGSENGPSNMGWNGSTSSENGQK